MMNYKIPPGHMDVAKVVTHVEVKLERIELKQGTWFQFYVRTSKYPEPDTFDVYEVQYSEDGNLILYGNKPIPFDTFDDEVE